MTNKLFFRMFVDMSIRHILQDHFKWAVIFSIILLGRSAPIEAQTFPDLMQAKPFPSASAVLSPSWIQSREDLNTAYLRELDPDRLLHNSESTRASLLLRFHWKVGKLPGLGSEVILPGITFPRFPG